MVSLAQNKMRYYHFNSKKDKNRQFLKNWRPLTLLNTDYKIVAKALANRILVAIPEIINEDKMVILKKDSLLVIFLN